MQILLAGNFQFDWYEEACAKALEELGHQVKRFAWHVYFSFNLIGKLENYTSFNGPMAHRANQAMLEIIKSNSFDLILVWRGTHISASLIQNIRRICPSCTIVSYNNDDPFSPLYLNTSFLINQRRLWKQFKQAIPYYDINFVYRPVNLIEYQQIGSKRTHLLLPYFIGDSHQPQHLKPLDKENFACDIVFVGHYEADGRAQYLKVLIDAGIHVQIFGNGWPKKVANSISSKLASIQPVLGADYVKALCGAKICLSFLSKLNRDTYTRRNFEIPACAAPMLSERTEDLQHFFADNQEAMYFSDQNEMLEKALFLLKNNDQRLAMGKAGFTRVWNDGHDVKSRMHQMLGLLSQSPYTVTT
jgi:spore maturation protein CgeB